MASQEAWVWQPVAEAGEEAALEACCAIRKRFGRVGACPDLFGKFQGGLSYYDGPRMSHKPYIQLAIFWSNAVAPERKFHEGG